MEKGWIKLFKKFEEWEWIDDLKMVKFFIILLLNTNYEDKKWQGMTIKRGQYVTSLNNLSNKLKFSVQTVRTLLNKLKSTNEITVETTNRYTIITICNYDNYQCLDEISNKQINKQTNKQITNKQQTINTQANKQITTTKEYKEYKEIKNKEIEPLKKTDKLDLFISLVPDDWKPSIKMWLEYKKERKEIYKTEKSFLMFFEKIKKEAGGEIQIFSESVEQSIKNNWAGVFPKKETEKMNNNPKQHSSVFFVNQDAYENF